MTYTEKQVIAKQVNGLLGSGNLNWLGDINMETKKEQFNLFFNKEKQAKQAKQALNNLGILNVKIVKTPKFVNNYFKFSVTIIL